MKEVAGKIIGAKRVTYNKEEWPEIVCGNCLREAHDFLEFEVVLDTPFCDGIDWQLTDSRCKQCIKEMWELMNG